jgi:hypothetical protein
MYVGPRYVRTGTVGAHDAPNRYSEQARFDKKSIEPSEGDG